MPFDYRSITDTIERSLASAGLAREAGMMKGITDTIHQSLSNAGLYPHEPQARGPQTREAPTGPGLPGELLERSFSNAAGTRAYELYVPSSYPLGSEPVPLVVMLHGCKQSPGDFSVGTRMNELAERHGFLVAYPAQPTAANGSSCWNWFRATDQARDQGEPSILAGIAREIASHHRVDNRRIFVAGMSAGAAMAVILGATYPELFAAVGAHSGLPHGAAHDVPSAFKAMKGGSARQRRSSLAVPTIVFHGAQDPTVNACNGAAIVEQATFAREHALHLEVTSGSSAGGCSYRRSVYRDASGRAAAEHWVVAGMGHAWSGGDARGSFTDARGPDASAEMIRFFVASQGTGTA
ncbi:esterase [Betaproteobacteria bacterium GR16-43]|nr:esterase [Betaproteobacteria bacterium GR16-43]